MRSDWLAVLVEQCNVCHRPNTFFFDTASLLPNKQGCGTEMRFVGLEQYFPVTGLVEQWSVFQSGHMDVEFRLQHSAGAVRFRANNFSPFC